MATDPQTTDATSPRGTWEFNDGPYYFTRASWAQSFEVISWNYATPGPVGGRRTSKAKRRAQRLARRATQHARRRT